MKSGPVLPFHQLRASDSGMALSQGLMGQKMDLDGPRWEVIQPGAILTLQGKKVNIPAMYRYVQIQSDVTTFITF